jgi:hypothetical protein
MHTFTLCSPRGRWTGDKVEWSLDSEINLNGLSRYNFLIKVLSLSVTLFWKVMKTQALYL